MAATLARPSALSTKAAPLLLTPRATPTATMDALKKSNWVAAALHTAAAIGFGALFAQQDAAKRSVRLTKTTVDPDTPPLNADNAIDFPPAAVPLEGPAFDVAPLVVGFFGVTALAHAAYASDVGGFYSRAILKGGANPWRWLEYGVSASMMAAIISGVDGVRDAVSLQSAVLATATMQTQGFLVERELKTADRAAWAERYNNGAAGAGDAPRVDAPATLVATLCGWLCYVLLWNIIITNFRNVTTDATNAGAPVPSWLGWIVGTQALFFASFGGVQLAQLAEARAADADARAGRPVRVRDFAAYEKTYIGLSFASKLSLAAILGYGLFQRAEVAGGGGGGSGI